MPTAIAIIPARIGSERFARKALANDTSFPLVWHVSEAARRATQVSRVVVATDAQAIADAVIGLGGEAILTGEHPNGTSRLAEAAAVLDLNRDAIVVNVQGDEPEIDPNTINAVVRALDQSGCDMATAACPFASGEDVGDPNMVKVVRSIDGKAMYFSRAPVPYMRHEAGASAALCHIGVYAYTRRFLEVYAALEPTPLERTESLEQLRALEHGHTIMVTCVGEHAPGIDTPEQYARFVERWLKN